MRGKWTEHEKQLARRIRQQDSIIADLHADVSRLTADRDLYRNWLKEKVRWFVDLLAENKTPNLAWTIKNGMETRERGLPQ